MEQRCDQIVDCRDKSDEDNCKLIVFEDNYNREEIFMSPETIDKSQH